VRVESKEAGRKFLIESVRGNIPYPLFKSTHREEDFGMFSNLLFLRFILSTTIVFLIPAAALSAHSEAKDLQVGTASVVINPPEGTPMSGYYHPRGTQGVLDDLLAKAVVFDDGHTRAAIVVCDLLGIPRPVVEASRKRISETTDIPAEHVMIAATHTHTGPSLIRHSTRDKFTDQGRSSAQNYTDSLPEFLARAVADAERNLGPAQGAFGTGTAPKLGFNRRFWMKDGSVGWNPGKLNPKIIRPIRSIDPEVGVVYFENSKKEPELTCVNYALHPDTTGGELVSADFPGALSRALAQVKGDEMMTLFCNGACGDINHINVNWKGRQKGQGEANRLGTILAGAVCVAYMDLTPLTDGSLQVRREMVPLELAPITEVDLKKARDVAAQEKASFLDRVDAFKTLDIHNRKGEPIPAEVQVISLGSDVAWVGLPGEIFVDLGLSIKENSPFALTQVVELANGSPGYIPHRSAYAEGQYEVVSSRVAAGSGEKLVEVATKLLEACHE
jgi:hypothetical protein